MADATGSLHQHVLSGLDGGAIDQPFPGSNECQWQRRGVSHAEPGRLMREQPLIDRGKLRQ